MTTTPSLESLFDLKINGTAAAKTLVVNLLECTVENSIHLPDVCTFRMYDEDFEYASATTFSAGTKIEFLVGYETDSPLKSIFQGEVVGLEMDMDAAGVPVLTVRCYDLSHRLHRGRQVRTFANVTDSDIASQVAADVDLTPDVDSTPDVYDWVMQYNQTDWEFLSERAARNGYRLYVSGANTMCFKAVSDAADATVSLTWGESLLSFRPRVSASPQVNQVSVRGWDVSEKQALIGTSMTAQGTPAIGLTGGGETAHTAFGNAIMTVVDRPMFSQREAQTMAQSVLDDIGGGYVEADGRTYGAPAIKPGAKIEINNIGTRFNGTYFVTSATHHLSARDGYMTFFSVSGKRPATVLGATDWDGGGRRAPLGGNIVVAIVTQIAADTTHLGRVKVKYPWLSDDNESDWVRLVNPMGGPGRGWEFVPEINDEVLVAFEHGDVHRPYILGGLWNGKDAPPLTTEKAVVDGMIVRRVIKTRLGHRLLFKDTDDKGGIAVITNSNHRIELHDNNNQILVKTQLGHQVLLDDDNKQIVVKDMTGSNSMTINSTENSISMVCTGNFSIEAAGTVSIKSGAAMSMESGAAMTATSADEMSLLAGAAMAAVAADDVSIAGTMVMING